MHPLIPSRSFSLETRLPAEEVVARLAAATEPVRWFRTFLEPHRAFQGEVTGTEFRIMRIIGYRNSFLPIFRGRIVATPTGSRVEGTMEMHPAVAVFAAVWFAVAITFGLLIIAFVTMRDGWNPVVLAPVGLFLAMWGVTRGAFALEARWSLGLLREIVAAESEAPTASSAA